MTDGAPASSDDREIGRVVTLLQVITGLLVIIAIALLVILARGPEDQQRAVMPALVAALSTRA
jgi:hypothetical protein